MSDDFYQSKKILVTGGAGLLGSHVIEQLLEKGANIRTVMHKTPISKSFKNIEIMKGDLTEKKTCQKVCKDIDYVFHIAAFVGGIGLNVAKPIKMFTPNILMTTNLLQSSLDNNVDRFLFCSSASVYPDSITFFTEDQGWLGLPHVQDRAYGWMKRTGEFQAWLFNEYSDLQTAVVRMTNAYGPRDNFNLEKSHVVPALIKKAVERFDPYYVWGDGTAKRDFIHAQDAARGMIMTLEKYAVGDPVNIASGTSVTIEYLVNTILRISEYNEAKIVFDNKQPEGHKIKIMDVKKAKNRIGFRSEISLEQGLENTIKWYKENRGTLNIK